MGRLRRYPLKRWYSEGPPFEMGSRRLVYLHRAYLLERVQIEEVKEIREGPSIVILGLQKRMQLL